MLALTTACIFPNWCSVNPEPTTDPIALTEAMSPWSVRRRAIASVLILFFLAIVVSGPLTNPIYTEELTGPLGRFMAPFHQTLYLGHGYRFFAPDPGPSHLVIYRITREDGTEFTGRFPHPRQHWPRVIYHRWFMLSETMFEEHIGTPDRESFDSMQNELQEQIERFRAAGQRQFVRQVEQMYERQAKSYDRAQRRIPALVESVARELLRRHGGQRIELFIQERGLPAPADVIVGMKLDDSRFLSEPRLIGQWENTP